MKLGFPYINQNTKCPSKLFNFADGTNVLSPSINFSRTTNATVTNSAGQITYAPHNLLTYSEQFDNAAWVKFNTTSTANTTVAPNGTTTADTLNEGTATNVHQITQAFAFATATNYTLTVYAKYIDNPYIYLSATRYDSGNTYASAAFNIKTGTFVTSASLGVGYSVVGTPTISPAGNGWYRCSVTITFGTGSGTGNSAFFIYQGNTGTIGSFGGENYTGTNRTVYIWGAQLEIGSTATTYNSTTVKNLLGYSELFDNAAWTKSNSFVQTNVITYSEAFDNVVWSAFGTKTITANAGIAPNGYQTADYLNSPDNNGIQQSVPVTATTAYTYSIYAKADVGTSIRMSYTTVGGTVVSGSVDTVISSGQSVGNGWYRISLSFTTGTGNTSAVVRAQTATTSGIYIWGAQLVQGSDAGAYRRTDSASLPCYYPNHNGVVCAEKLVESATTNPHATFGNLVSFVTGQVFTWSVYAKAAERQILQFVLPSGFGGSGFANFNLSTGQIGSSNIGTPAISSLGNGWYRCSITATATGTGTQQATINIVTSSTSARNESYAGDGTSGIYIFGAQLSDSASLDPYVLNAAAAPSAQAYYGARFDYDPVTLAPKGLLIEEQRTNLLLNSSILGTALGTQLVTVTAVAHTLSFYGTGTVAITGTYTGSLVGSGAYPTRSTLTFTPTAGVITLTVTGTVQFAQLEAGAFATSYIPTAASQVTRASDVATIQGSNFYSWYNQNEGSVVTNASGTTSASGAPIVSISDATANNSVNVGNYAGGTDYGVLYVRTNGGAAQASLTATVNPLIFNKGSAGYKHDSFAGSVNNGTVLTDTSGVTPIVTRMQIGTSVSSVYLNGAIKSISYYPQRLSNEVLKGLTA